MKITKEMVIEESKKFKDEWLEKGTRCGISSKEEKVKCEKAISSFYEYSKKDVPKYFIWVRSPKEAMKLITNFEKLSNDTDDVSIVTKRLKKEYDKLSQNFVDTSFWGQQDGYWIAFYKCGEKLGCKYPEKELMQLNGFVDIANAAFWWWPYEEVCIISERPIELHLNEKLQKHADLKAAISFADGYKLFYLNDIEMPENIVLTPSEKIDPKLALDEKNTDVQREIIRKIGYDKMLKACNAKIIELWTDPKTGLEYTMRHMKFGAIDRRCLCYEHASMPGIFYAKNVIPEAKNILQARAFQIGIDGLKPEEIREKLRKNEYSDKYILENLPEKVQ
jgi:hypothetical protein